MAKVVFRKLVGSKSRAGVTAVTQKRVRDANTGEFLILRTINADSKTLGQDLDYVFGKNVAKARRENKAVTGVVDLIPAKA